MVKLTVEGDQITVSNGLSHHTLSMDQMFQSLEFLDILNRYITECPEEFQNDPIWVITQINEQVSFGGKDGL